MNFFFSKLKTIYSNLFESKQIISNSITPFIHNEHNLKHFEYIQITINNPKHVNSKFSFKSTIYEATIYFSNKEQNSRYYKNISNNNYEKLIDEIKNTVENDLKI